MRIGKNGKVIPFQTKVGRIQDLEEAMALIEKADSLELAQNIAIALRRVDARWSKKSPLSYENLKEVEDQIGGV